MSKYQQQIENAVALRGTISIAELSEMLGVSDQTIRRIVKPLEEAGRLQKIHGAIRSVDDPVTAPFQARMEHNRQAKARIATRMLDLVSDGQSLAIDTGSTSGFVAQALQERRNLTVVTNSAYVASTLAMRPGNRVFMAGTQLRDHDGAAFDRAAFATIERMQVDQCILSAAQVHPTRGFLVGEQCEADIAVAMAGIAKQTVMAVDHSKFTPEENARTIAIPGLPADLILLTDAPLPAGFDQLLPENQLVFAGI